MHNADKEKESRGRGSGGKRPGSKGRIRGGREGGREEKRGRRERRAGWKGGDDKLFTEKPRRVISFSENISIFLLEY